MAEDAAGAVRRTPRPARVDQPILRDRLIEQAAVPIAENQLRRYDKEFDARHLCAEDFMPDAREDARTLAERGLLTDPEQRRPVVLLPAEGCTCSPPYAECPHGPEPVDALDLALWLHAEANYFRNWTLRAAELELASHGRAEDKLTAELEDVRQHARNVAAQRDVEHRAFVEAAAERDEAVALCANLQTTLLNRLADLTKAAGKQRSTEWLRTCATLPMEEWPPAPAYKGPMVPAADLDALSLLLRAMARKLVGYRRWTLGDDVPAVHQLRRERDALQARLDATFADLKEADELSADWPPSLEDWSAYNSKLIHARAALQGDQPAGEATS